MIVSAITAWFATVVWPIIVAFAGWIAAAAAAILAFLFSPAIRKYTIAVLCFLFLMGFAWVNGYITGKSGGVQNDICLNPNFHQITLTGKNSSSTIAAVREHNDLGEALGCWSNANIR